MKLIAKTCLILLVFVVAIPVANAHQTGASWEKIVGDYKIDVGYDPTTIVAGQPERLDFNILDTKTGEGVPFSDVWIRISQGQDTVFASGIHRLTFGLTGMIFDFPKSGEFNLNVRFENDDNTIVQTDLPISVIGDGSAPPTASRSSVGGILAAGFIGLVLGAGIDFLMRRKVK